VKKAAFFAECGNNFGMPQVQLPIFPAGATHINSEVAFEERDGKVYCFNGHLPVFVHEKSALATFRLFSIQLVINGNATQAEISRAFGVPLVTIKRYVKLYREHGAAAFFAPAKKALLQSALTLASINFSEVRSANKKCRMKSLDLAAQLRNIVRLTNYQGRTEPYFVRRK
jgi:transposase-like protein